MNPQQIALILIDIQRDFWQPLKKYPQFAAFPQNIGTLLSEARAKGLTVVHIQSSFKPDRSDWMLFYRPQGRGDVPCITGTKGALYENFTAPLPNEHVIQKQTFDSFANTELEQFLKARNVKAVLVAGLETSVCILFTATSAYLRRIVPLVVVDACVDEPAKHETMLRLYGDLCFKVITTKQIQNDWTLVLSIINQFLDD